MKISQANHSVGPRSGDAPNLLNSSRSLDRLATATGFLQRRTANLKLTPKRLVLALVASALSGQHSLSQLAFQVGLLLDDDTYSKQSMGGRIGANAVAFVKAVVGRVLAASAASIAPLHLRALPGILRILVGDSSVFSFHPSLHKHFPGASNQHGARCAQNRFQLVFDLLSGKWLEARSDPYKRTDRRAAADIVATLVQAGDLIIRDLGYAVTPVFAAIAAKGAYFLSRLDTTAAVLNSDGKCLDVLALARAKAPNEGDEYSIEILLSKSHRFPCRLVLRNEGGKVGDTRRQRLAASGKRRGKIHKADYLALQNWTLMVTNLDEATASTGQICELYRLRWRIENVFKVAKSHTSLEKLLAHRSNRHHIELLMWGWVLAMVHMGMHGVFAIADVAEVEVTAGNGEGTDTAGAGEANALAVEEYPKSYTEVTATEKSVFKAMQRLLWCAALSIELSAAGSMAELQRRIAKQSAYHHRLEKRRTRITLPQRMQSIFDVTIQKECLS